MRFSLLILLCFFSCSSLHFHQDIINNECIPSKFTHKRIVKDFKNKIHNNKIKQDDLKRLESLSHSHASAYFLALQSEIYWNQQKFFKAEENALKALDLCSENFPELYYILGDIAFQRKDFKNSYLFLKKSFKSSLEDPYFSDASILFSKAKQVADILNNPVEFKPFLLSAISTKNDEYLPVISPDQESLFFTQRSRKKLKGKVANNIIVEDFMFSNLVENSFVDATLLPYPFNIESNEGGASITIDNKTLFYTKCSINYDGYKNCDIYYVKRVGSKWSEPYKLPDYISSSDSWDSQPTISSDGLTLIFASDRSGGLGKTDLYETNFIDNKWSKPKNIGPIINSNFDEKSPFLHADGLTLFYASNNMPTVGGFDIFYSRKDSSGNWGQPINIGFPINTDYDELSMVVSTDGNTAYFASNKLDGIGGWDLYQFSLYEKAKPNRVFFLKGNIVSSDDNLNDIEIELKNMRTQEITVIKADSMSYVASLVLGKNDDVLMTVKKEGFAFKSQYFSSDDALSFSPLNSDIRLTKLEEGKSFKIDNIYFDNNSFEITSFTRNILIEFADYLQVNNTLVIEVNGYTDNIGNEEDNQVLSEKRAKAVLDIIDSCGVNSSRISYNGYGEKYPVADNENESGRAKNRRTEFKIIKK